jgi:acetyl-CoA/propionyl-CoA carboxylase biotin carboxyl carrier protein
MTFGNYELLEKIAEGGMGVVYRARQRAANRVVALKMIREGGLASAAEVQVGDREPVRASASRDGDRLTVTVDGESTTYVVVHRGGALWLAANGRVAALREHERLHGGSEGVGGDGVVTAPMPGTVTVVRAAVGDSVAAGTPLLVVEAMKMEHVLTAPVDGTVTELPVTAGQQVRLDERLAVVTSAAGEGE